MGAFVISGAIPPASIPPPRLWGIFTQEKIYKHSVFLRDDHGMLFDKERAGLVGQLGCRELAKGG